MEKSSDNFVLRSTVTSPFGRKVRMAIEVLGLRDRVVLVPANPLDDKDSLRQQNPLGKMPCLILHDGSAIYDSGVIIEYLADATGSPTMLPAGGLARYKALTLARLADGITEAALLMVYEGRFREDRTTHSQRWLDHQRGKIWWRSGFLARSAISTGASRWTGGRSTRTWRAGWPPLPITSRPSSAPARRTHKFSLPPRALASGGRE